MASLAKGADRVVVGRVVKVEFGPDEGGDVEFVFRTARVTVQDGRTKLPVEVASGLSLKDAADETMAGLKAALPKADAIWFLRSLERHYPGVLRPINSASIVEAGPTGTAQPAFYRSTAADARTGKRSVDHGALIDELVRTKFDVLTATVSTS